MTVEEEQRARRYFARAAAEEVRSIKLEREGRIKAAENARRNAANYRAIAERIRRGEATARRARPGDYANPE